MCLTFSVLRAATLLTTLNYFGKFRVGSRNPCAAFASKNYPVGLAVPAGAGVLRVVLDHILLCRGRQPFDVSDREHRRVTRVNFCRISLDAC